ncbi:MAG: hypothetical protein JXR51_14155 [Bacteroidales bacterium]|nr:hypothetical protein [Bacteroidales bacterium]
MRTFISCGFREKTSQISEPLIFLKAKGLKIKLIPYLLIQKSYRLKLSKLCLNVLGNYVFEKLFGAFLEILIKLKFKK